MRAQIKISNDGIRLHTAAAWLIGLLVGSLIMSVVALSCAIGHGLAIFGAGVFVAWLAIYGFITALAAAMARVGR